MTIWNIAVVVGFVGGVVAVCASVATGSWTPVLLMLPIMVVVFTTALMAKRK